MKIIKKEAARASANSDNCKTLEYSWGQRH